METTIFGPPGTGKTTTLINIVKQELENGTSPDKIGFVSFSRKAADEAKQRTVDTLGIDPRDLDWFRTLHSMAFRFNGMTTKDVMRSYDYRELGELVGMEFNSNASLTMADGNLFTQGKKGDAYLGMIQMARVRGVTLEKQFNDTHDYKMHYQQARIINNALEGYKREAKKKDFVDMIDDFITKGRGPMLDVLIVDEAQDLAPLQWRMVHEVLRPNSKRIYYAGDDDQCIYSWMGVRVGDFLNACENKQILTQSYRVPTQVHELSERIVKRLSVRQEKNWKPADHTGTVVWHYDIMDVDIRTGEWLILARTNYIANQICTQIKDSGYLFFREGSGWSISPNILESIEVWLRLCKGQALSAQQIAKFEPQIRKDFLIHGARKKLQNLNPEVSYTLQDLKDNYLKDVSEETSWYEIINVSERERVYITSVRKMGEKILTNKPRIKISTIHKAKGGEADNVLLLLDSSKAALEGPDYDSEIRTFYVGMTRAKKTLHLIEPKTKWGFEL